MIDPTLLIVPIVSFVIFHIHRKKQSETTAQSERKEEAVYNIEPIDSPRLVGWKLTVFPKILRLPVIGNAILSYLKEINKFSKVLTLASTLSNTLYYPLHIMSEEERLLHEAMNTESPLSIEELAKENIPESKLDDGNCIFRYWSIYDYTTRYKSGEITPLEVAKVLIQKLKQVSEYTPIIVFMDEEDFLRQAAESTSRYERDVPMGVLDGVPIAVKDEVPVKGFPISKGTSFMRNMVTEDCPCIASLRKEGAMIVGKTNQHELGLGTTGFNRFYKTPRNPHNYDHYTGGSSSGSAAAVASGLVPLAIGTDGGGSIRIPSALCGVVGLKPTFRRIPYPSSASSVASIGPIAGCLNDAALAYAIMAGPSDEDYQKLSQFQPKPHLHHFINGPERLEGLRVGFFRAHVEDANERIVKATMKTIDHLRSLGASVVEIEIPHLREIHLAHPITISTECYMGISHYDEEFKNSYSGEVQCSLELSKSFSSHYFLAAQKVRGYAMSVSEELFSTQIDILISPASATTAPVIPKNALSEGESNLRQTVELMKYSIFGNFTGLPGLVIPPTDYEDETKLPISILLQSAHWREDLLFRVAKACENIRPHGILKPQCYVGGGLDGPKPEISKVFPKK